MNARWMNAEIATCAISARAANWPRGQSRIWKDHIVIVSDRWDDTALRRQDSKLEPWRSEVENATPRWLMFPTILNPYEWAGKKRFLSLKLESKSGVQTRDLRAVLTTAAGPPPVLQYRVKSLNQDI